MKTENKYDVWFSSDWHFGHKNIHKFRTKFATPQENHEYFISLAKQRLSKRSTLWLLGDIAFTPEAIEMLKEIPCKINLLLGNHCFQHVSSHIYRNFLASPKINKVVGVTMYKGMRLSHAPLHPAELRGSINIHGHTHGNMPAYDENDKYFFSVCPEDHDYQLVNLETILEYKNLVGSPTIRKQP